MLVPCRVPCFPRSSPDSGFAIGGDPLLNALSSTPQVLLQNLQLHATTIRRPPTSRGSAPEAPLLRNDPTQEQIIDDYISYCILDTKFNVNYKIAITYDYQNTLILLYYSLIYYHTTLIKKKIV
jgi:hypothetical protein